MKPLSLAILFLLLAAGPSLAANDSEEPEMWAEDLRGSSGTSQHEMPETPQSAASGLSEEKGLLPPPAAELQDERQAGMPLDHTEVPSAAGISQRKAADLRSRVERLENRIGQNEREIKDLEERVRILHRNFDEIRRRR